MLMTRRCRLRKSLDVATRMHGMRSRPRCLRLHAQLQLQRQMEEQALSRRLLLGGREIRYLSCLRVSGDTGAVVHQLSMAFIWYCKTFLYDKRLPLLIYRNYLFLRHYSHAIAIADSRLSFVACDLLIILI